MLFSLFSKTVRLWVYTPNIGCLNPLRAAFCNFIRNKFCKPSINDCF